MHLFHFAFVNVTTRKYKITHMIHHCISFGQH